MSFSLQFFLQNFHFALNLGAGLVMLMVTWLTFDSWLNRKQNKELWRWLGFLLLTISFLLRSTVVGQSTTSSLSHWQSWLATTCQLVSYVLIIISQILDPLQPKPKTKGLGIDDPAAPAEGEIALGVNPALVVFLPLGSLAIAGMYYRRATKGLERHLLPVSISFLFLALSDIAALATLARHSANVTVYNLAAVFGPIWLLEQAFLLVGVVILGRWAWQYLVTRLQSQLFMIVTSMIAGIFLVVATSFTYLLIDNVRTQALDNLNIAAKTLNYAITAKQSETLSQAESLASNPDFINAVAAGDHDRLNTLTASFLASKKLSSLIITNTDGAVLIRGEDPDRHGDSISSDTAIRRAAIGTESSTVAVVAGVLAPSVLLRSTTPLKQNNLVVGAVTVGLTIGSEFVDGIKAATNLDTTIYAGEVRSATTFTAADGKSRLIGLKETDPKVLIKVLKNNQTFEGQTSSNNTSYLAVFAPLKDADNATVGMLFVGEPQAKLFETASRSVELSFLIVGLLLLLSIYPSYRVATLISNQVS